MLVAVCASNKIHTLTIALLNVDYLCFLLICWLCKGSCSHTIKLVVWQKHAISFDCSDVEDAPYRIAQQNSRRHYSVPRPQERHSRCKRRMQLV